MTLWMTPWIALWNQCATSWAEALFRTCWQGALAILGVWLICRSFPRMAPWAQSWLWRLAYLKLLVLFLWTAPFSLPLLPPSPSPAATTGSPAEALSSQFSQSPAIDAGVELVAGPDSSTRAGLEDRNTNHVLPDQLAMARLEIESRTSAVGQFASTQSSSDQMLPTWSAWMLSLWMLGAALSTCVVVREWFAFRHFLRCCQPVADSRVLTVLEKLRAEFGLRRLPKVMTTQDARGPQLAGIAQPVVVLPATMLFSASEAELRMVLAHELAHLSRRDLLWNLLSVGCQVLFFFHPLVWLARRQLRLAQEMACDELASRAFGGSVAQYGQLLLLFAARHRVARASTCVAVAVSESFLGLKRRLSAMKHFQPLSTRRRTTLALLLVAVAIAGVLPWRITTRTAFAGPLDPPANAGATARQADENAASEKAAVAAAGQPQKQQAAVPAATPRRWVYAQPNFQEEKDVALVLDVIARMARSGYNGLVLADYRFNLLDRMPPEYFKNVERVRAAAEASKIEIIPVVFPLGGYSGGLLANDPNLAEGLPVKAAPFAVTEGEAVLVADAAVKLANGDLEEATQDYFPGFDLQDDPGKSTFADRQVFHQGKIALRMQDFTENDKFDRCRISKRVKVRPYSCYRLSCWVKTENFKTESPHGFQLLALRPGTEKQWLKDSRAAFSDVFTKPTADWTQVEVVFNSLDQTELDIYAGVWFGREGKLWLDELKLEEVSLFNVLRRDGCPLVVASDDGKTTYEEGRDFEPVADAKLGRDPYPGRFDVYHAGPKLRLTKNSRIKDGDRLRVSWYHAVVMGTPGATTCFSDPKLFAVLRDQARRINDLFKPKTYMMSHQVSRVVNWCQACREHGKTPGELLAENVRRCIEILKDVSPQARVAVWSDMFDPHHNAREGLYLVNGTFWGSWAGLPPNVIIVNRNTGHSVASLNWFAGRGHEQVIGVYEDKEEPDSGERRRDAAGLPTEVGFIYLTWQKKYDHLEEYAKAEGPKVSGGPLSGRTDANLK